jgi:hypothetical protein
MANIIKEIIPPPPISYEAIVYSFKNITTDMIYIGSRFGHVHDGYLHSSTNNKMHDDFQNMSHEWEYEILHYGTKEEMRNMEYEILTKNNASKNPKFYNLHNGSPLYKKCKIKEIAYIVECIDNFKFLQDDELDKSKLQKLIDGGIQVRINSSEPKFTRTIQTLIDDRGDTSNANPLVLIESKKGIARLLNGNTTAQATINSKHSNLKLKYQVIPYDLIKNFSSEDIRALGLAFNPKPTKPSNPTNKYDAAAYIITAYQKEKRPIRDESNLLYLKDILKFNSKQRIEVFNEVESQISTGNINNTTPLIRYSEKSKKPLIKEKVLELENRIHNSKVFAYSSSMIRYGDIIAEFIENENKPNKDKFLNIIVLIHFASYSDIINWEQNRSKDDFKKMKSLCGKYGLQFSGFEYMPKY